MNFKLIKLIECFNNWLTLLPTILLVLMISIALGLSKAGVLKFSMTPDNRQVLQLMPTSTQVENDPLKIKKAYQDSCSHFKTTYLPGDEFQIQALFTYDELIKHCKAGEYEIFIIVNPGRCVYYGEFKLGD